MSYKNVLIISDNLHLCKELKTKLDKRLSSVQSLTYAVSPYSNFLNFSNELGKKVLVYNLKDDIDLEDIILRYDLVISIHCKQFFPKKLVNSLKCINIHPGYNPINRGWYPQVFAIINSIPVGATIHEIDEELDHGAIIDQEFVQYDYSDTSLTLYNKILEKEIEIFEKNIDSILTNTYTANKPLVEGNLYLKKDFNNLCEINLEDKVTFGEAINRLRALTHGEFKNAFFIDPETKAKIFVSVSLSKKK